MLPSFEEFVSTYHRVKEYGNSYGSFKSIDMFLETPKPQFGVRMDVIKTSLKIPKDVQFLINNFLFLKDVPN